MNTILRAFRTWACLMFSIVSFTLWLEFNPPINVWTILLFVNMMLLALGSTLWSLLDTIHKDIMENA
jgi:hypothetical protein